MKLASLSAAALLALLAIEAANGNEPPTPKSVEDLWSGFVELDQGTPLEAEVLKTWEQDGVSCRIVRYQVGIFKGAPSRVAAFYAYPTGQTNLPAILEMHGGGQSASLASVVRYAKRGYEAMSINWGGNKMSLGAEQWTGPQTDWGKLDATHPPQRNTANHFAESLAPDDYTLDSVESPRNSNWFLVLMAARRAITFLEQQPEVDAARIGALGHSMGGKLTTNLAGIDKRIKAAVPSCGGSGDLVISEAAHPGGSRTKRTAMELACISDNAYIPLITCPMTKSASAFLRTSIIAIRLNTPSPNTFGSRVLAVGPQQLKTANIKATDKPARLIDDGNRGWHDWYRLNWNHAPLWTVATQKLKDVKWRGPDGASLCFEIQCPGDNQLVLTFNCNAWGAFTPGAPALAMATAPRDSQPSMGERRLRWARKNR